MYTISIRHDYTVSQCPQWQAFIYTVLHVFSVSDYTASQIAMGIGEIRGMLRGRYCWLEAGWLANRLKFFILVRDSVKRPYMHYIETTSVNHENH